MIFEKIRERLQGKQNRVYQNFEYLLNEGKEKLAMLSEVEVQTYSDAIDIINQVETEYTNIFKQEYDKGYSDAEKHYMDVIDSQHKLIDETKDNNGWIPCSERLPETYGDYLCCDNYGEYIIGFPNKRDSNDDDYVEYYV